MRLAVETVTSSLTGTHAFVVDVDRLQRDRAHVRSMKGGI